jgi:hypothetical protein
MKDRFQGFNFTETRKRVWNHGVDRYLRERDHAVNLPWPVLEEYQMFYPDIAQLYAQAPLWRGLGRYQYSKTGETIDLIPDLLLNGFQPRRDIWVSKQGEDKTVSLARSRMYARLYSDMFRGEQTSDDLYRYGTRRFWSDVFISDMVRKMAAEAIRNHSVFDWVKKRISGEYLNENRLERWVARVTKNTSRATLFNMLSHVTSDIKGNYPIVVGIHGSLHEYPVPVSLQPHEVRTDQAIFPSNFTHLEVPYVNIPETLQRIGELGLQIPVFPLEFGDLLSREFTYKQLVDGNYNK